MNGKKIFFFDLETSGLDELQHAILTFSGIVDLDGKIIDKIDLKMKPFKGDKISPEALKINKLTIEEIKTFDDPYVAFKKLIEFFSKYIDRYDKNDKFTLAGYNIIKFDIPFLKRFFMKCNDKYFGSWVNGYPLDVYQLVVLFRHLGYFKLDHINLENIAKYLNIPINAHDAKEDIIATRKIYYELMNKIEIKK